MMDEAQASTTSSGQDSRGKAVGRPRASSGGLRRLTIMAAGAVVTGLIVTAVISPGGMGMMPRSPVTDSSVEPTLAPLASSELAEAMGTLDPATSQQAVADAKSCKAPIAWVTLVKQPGSPEGSVRIRSGSYLSPAFRVTATPQRVAIPYPGPYATGHGVLWAVGEGSGLTIYLSPGWNIPSLNGAAAVNVHWTPKNPC
jgi:hypothetical protein